jgi:hypothetical protein
MYAEKCQSDHLKINPREAWDMVFKLMEGFHTHHRRNTEKNFKSKDGRIAKSSDVNAKILKTHFSELFNNQVEVDMTVLEDIPNLEVQHKLGDTPSAAEIRKAISKMENNKAPGKSGLTTDMIKNLPPKAHDLYVELIQEFWRDESVDFNSWHTTILNTEYPIQGQRRPA